MARASLRSKRLKDPGFSSIEDKLRNLHIHCRREKYHPQYFKIEGMLKGLILQLKKQSHIFHLILQFHVIFDLSLILVTPSKINHFAALYLSLSIDHSYPNLTSQLIKHCPCGSPK